MTEDELLLENQKLRDKLAGTLKELEWLRLWNELDRSNAEVAEQELVRLRKIHEKEIVQALQKKIRHTYGGKQEAFKNRYR